MKFSVDRNNSIIKLQGFQGPQNKSNSFVFQVRKQMKPRRTRIGMTQKGLETKYLTEVNFLIALLYISILVLFTNNRFHTLLLTFSLITE